MKEKEQITTFPSLSHWGAYRVEARDGRLVSVAPFEHDPEPSPLIEAMTDGVHHPCRIEQPMVRQGFLENGYESDRAGRGTEPFVPVTWDQALDLAAAELARVRSTHGNGAIFGASGWGSAGSFHNARQQLSRFLIGFGGYVKQVTNYSFGAASVILPHVVGSMAPKDQPTTWPTIVKDTRLLLMFGGIAPKNSQVSQGGLGTHETQDWLRAAHRAGTHLVCVSPLRDDMADELEAEWLPLRPNTDTAMMLGLAHTLVAEGLHDEAFLHRNCTGFERFHAYLTGEVDGILRRARELAQPL